MPKASASSAWPKASTSKPWPRWSARARKTKQKTLKRKRLRCAIHLLEEEKGHIRPLEDNLHGYRRVKVRSYRIICANRRTKRPGPPEFGVLFCEHRANLYEALSAIVVTRFPM